MTQSRYSDEEIAQRGDEVYDTQISDQEKQANIGRIVAIDVNSGVYEIADDELSAADRLEARCPGAEIWFRRVGYRALHRMGAHPSWAE
jgi:hypothetical protein